MSVIEVGIKTLYKAEGIEASEWVKNPPVVNPIDTPKLSSGLSVCENTHTVGKSKNALGVFVNMTNCPQQNQIVYLLSEKPSHKGSCHTDLEMGEGWRRSIALLSARKLSKRSWINDKDEYLVPSVYSNTEK